MKRVGNLFEQVVDRSNLRLAFARASRGKQSREEVRRFGMRLDQNLIGLAAELRAGTFPLGRFHQFVIHDPKERIITAPCFAERLLNHAVMNVCEPVFEQRLISDTYACRRGRGRIAGLLRAQAFARRFPFFLKMDARRYFDSISHGLLPTQLERVFKERQLMDLFERNVRSFRGMAGRGLPIGSLTSQHFANFYLGAFDRLVARVIDELAELALERAD